MAKDDGGHVYPSAQPECLDGSWNQTFDPGIKLRDWLIGQNIKGLLSNPAIMTPERFEDVWRGTRGGKHIVQVAEAHADAALAARKETSDE